MNQLCFAKHESLQQKRAATHLVPFRGTASDIGVEQPIFCIHPSGGDVGVYRKLVRNLPPAVSAVGIQSRLIAGEKNEFDSIDEMAFEYAQLINHVQAEGPIRILGFSFGGFVATAIANHLMDQQRDISFLGMIDSDLRWVNDEASIRHELAVRLTQLSQQFQALGLFNKYTIGKTEEDVRSMVTMSRASDKVSFDQWLEFLQSRGYIDHASPQVEALCRFADRFKTHCNLLTQFTGEELKAPMHLWWPTEPATNTQARREAWQALNPHPIVERELDGSHYSVMRMPTVATLAKDIATAVARSSS